MQTFKEEIYSLVDAIKRCDELGGYKLTGVQSKEELQWIFDQRTSTWHKNSGFWINAKRQDEYSGMNDTLTDPSNSLPIALTPPRTELYLTSSTNSDPSDVVALYQQESIKQLRKNALLTAEIDRKTLFNASRLTNNQDFYRKVVEEAYCAQKERIGEKGDGGKYVCNPKKVKKDCTLISLSLNNQIGFDKHIYEATGRQCKILGADIYQQEQPTRDAYEKMNGELFAAKIPNDLTIPQMLEKAGRIDVEFLKIDIEKGEFTALEPLIKDYFVCQIFIEIHGLPSDHLRMLQIIAKYGFRIFNVDENLLCPLCCEYSMINELCMAQFEVVPLAITIPQLNS
ncbi:hypothetical protein GCK72_012493 [Caenorhabditis remanei]|uniref:Methyltransferase FkbM domain-containing protein n=1 Tax=Caenorhabditis remanei TaxID=31234 RepID=A0A6A5GL61_CAERE|nr:hypothetical protein GCK72_012493 [Caenorhabditis remanei]KAF1756040.1 hypothetical protein GCK72_012493 [Caenorhabditis remanei]